MRRMLLTAAFVSATLACGGILGEQQHALDPGDHAVLIEARDIQSSFPALVVDSSRETWSKVYSLGSWELEYTYEPDDGFFLSSMVFLEDTVSDAETVMWGATLTTSLFEAQGIEYSKSSDVLTIGDAQECGYLLNEGVKVGNFCIVRKGSNVYVFSFVGGVYDGPGALDAVLGPALTALDTHVIVESPIDPEPTP